MTHPFLHNVPFFSIFLLMIVGIVCPLIRRGAVACRITLCALALTAVGAGALTVSLVFEGQGFTYMMGHFPAPWGNELYVDTMESTLACAFSLVAFFSLLGGWEDARTDIKPHRHNLYFVMLNLMQASMLVLIYTNDIFTGYVFIEILTISSCAIIAAKDSGRALSSTMSYLVISLLGSGLFLLSVCILYQITGHLLMPQLGETVAELMDSGAYHLPLTVCAGMLFLGLGVKSALFPFHPFLPPAHAASTTTSSALLSGLAIKPGIILGVRLIQRVFTPETFSALGIDVLLFVLGGAGMITGSVLALREVRLKRMLADSSIAQLGYIFVAMGLGTGAGLTVALFHLLSHAAAKPLLFLSGAALSRQCGGTGRLREMKGAACRDYLAGVGFAVGALSLIGLPLLAGFAAKLLIMETAISSPRMWLTLALLAVSSVLNALYYLPAIIRIWTRPDGPETTALSGRARTLSSRVAIAGMTALVFALGIWFQPTLRLLESAL